jgi:hypothetical protein
MPDVNLLAVLLCGIASLMLGGLWYSPLLFARTWQNGVGLTDEQMKGGSLALIFGAAFALSLLAAYVFGMFLGSDIGLWPSVGAGAAAGVCWVAASFGISYLFERRSLRLWLINGGYHAVQFTLFGLIMGLFQR